MEVHFHYSLCCTATIGHLSAPVVPCWLGAAEQSTGYVSIAHDVLCIAMTCKRLMRGIAVITV